MHVEYVLEKPNVEDIIKCKADSLSMNLLKAPILDANDIVWTSFIISSILNILHCTFSNKENFVF